MASSSQHHSHRLRSRLLSRRCRTRLISRGMERLASNCADCHRGQYGCFEGRVPSAPYGQVCHYLARGFRNRFRSDSSCNPSTRTIDASLRSKPVHPRSNRNAGVVVVYSPNAQTGSVSGRKVFSVQFSVRKVGSVVFPTFISSLVSRNFPLSTQYLVFPPRHFHLVTRHC